MSTVSPDRRILKAFYTQYVAVLLIVLVFVVSGFRDRQAFVNSPSSLPQNSEPSIGKMVIRSPYDPEAGVSDVLASELDAIAELVRSHDVKATISVPLARAMDAESQRTFTRALKYARTVREYILRRGAPEEALRVVLSEGENMTTPVSVTFSLMELSHEG